MADKTTTLKTKTNDNVYPNVIGDNRKNAFDDSSTITHHFYDQTHKVGFQIANEANIKIQNSLQKPSGLTKTELVGVGANGQENIEIGDNLTLANGKLSATGGSGGNDINVLTVNGNTFTGSIKQDKINLIKLNDNISLVGIGFVSNFLNMLFGFAPDMNSYGNMTGNLRAHILIEDNDKNVYQSMGFNLVYYSHFITLSSPTIGSINFNFYYDSIEKFTIDRLKRSLEGKFNTCSGYIDDGGTKEIATYIAGEAGGLTIGWFDPSDGSTGGTMVDSTFSISDDVSLVGD